MRTLVVIAGHFQLMTVADPIKMYENVDDDRRDLSFNIKRTEDIFAVNGGLPDAPHRHNYYTVIVLEHARGRHMIDFREYMLSDRQVYFVSPGQVHQMAETEPSVGWAVTFSDVFLVFNAIDPGFISSISLFRSFGDSPPLEPDPGVFDTMLAYCKAMRNALESQGSLTYQAIGAWLKLLLIEANNACNLPEKENTQAYHAGMSILKEFKVLLERDHMRFHKVAYYAEQLAVTPDHLNRTLKSLAGCTAKQMISDRIVLSAKRMLAFSDQPAKAIAYQLGFEEPSHFSTFFKRETGHSPTAFRSVRIGFL